MPRVNLGRNYANEELVTLIWGTAAARGLDSTRTAAAAKMSPDTLRRRKLKPEDLTVGELRRLGRALGIPIDRLRSVISY